MEIQFQSHHANVPDSIRERAESAVRRLAARVRGTTDAVIRFEQDGRSRRVEIVMHAAGRRSLVAEATAPRFPSALSSAVQRLRIQAREARRPLRRTPLQFAESS